jgi:hypothetical protein
VRRKGREEREKERQERREKGIYLLPKRRGRESTGTRSFTLAESSSQNCARCAKKKKGKGKRIIQKKNTRENITKMRYCKYKTYINRFPTMFLRNRDRIQLAEAAQVAHAVQH